VVCPGAVGAMVRRGLCASSAGRAILALGPVGYPVRFWTRATTASDPRHRHRRRRRCCRRRRRRRALPPLHPLHPLHLHTTNPQVSLPS